MNNRKTLLLRGSLTLLAATVGILFFFRQFIFSGGEWVTGDMADGRLIMAIHEHWFRFLQGKDSWFDLGFFYPDRNALIYSDTFLLGGMVHAFLRSAGYDVYLAFQLTQMIWAVLGFAGMLTWLAGYRRVGFTYALFGAFLILVASPIYFSSRNSHIQLQSVWLIPWVLVLAEQCWRNLDRPGRGLGVTFAASCLLYGLIAYSTFYVAWFTLLLFLFWFISALVLYGWRPVREQVQRMLRRWPSLLPGALISAAMLSLFLATYLPSRVEQGGRKMAEAILAIPDLPDLINHSHSNLLWGKIFAHLHDYRLEYVWEIELGPTLMLTLCLAAFSIGFLRQKEGRLQPDVMVRRITALAALLSFLFLFRIGNFTLWTIPYHLVPGASAIRAPFRLNVVLMIPLVYLLAAGLQQLRATVPGIKGVCFTALLALLVVLEQGQTVPVGRINRKEELNRLQLLPHPPTDAEAFVIFGNYPHDYGRDIIQNSAILYAQHWNLPTISGRSGFNPKGWNLISKSVPELLELTSGWCRGRNITGKVYLFDNDTYRWGRHVHLKDNKVRLSDLKLDLLTPVHFPSIEADGWSKLEEWGVWSIGSRSSLKLPSVADVAYPLYLEIQIQGFLNKRNPKQTVEVLLDGKTAYTTRINQEDQTRRFEVKLEKDGMLLEFRVREPASPASTGQGNDPRELGVGLQALIIHAP